MGIKGFYSFIKKYVPNAIKIINIKDLKNLTLSVDANMMIYKNVMAIRKNGYDIYNNNKKITHIHSMKLKLNGFKKYNINPIFVFDGCAGEEKSEVIKKRKNMYIKMKKIYEKTKNKNIYYRIEDITNEEINECKEVIKSYGYTVIDSKEEADSQCPKISDYIISDDGDIILHGGNYLLKNFSVNEKKNFLIISRHEILKKLNFTQEQLITFGILLGCDYCNKTISPKKALKIVTEYKTFENIFKNKIIKYDINYTKAFVKYIT